MERKLKGSYCFAWKFLGEPSGKAERKGQMFCDSNKGKSIVPLTTL